MFGSERLRPTINCRRGGPAWPPSRPQSLRLRIVHRAEARPRRISAAGHLDLESAGGNVGRANPAGIADVAEPDGAAQGVAVIGGADAPDDAAVPPDRLVVIEQGLGVLERELDEA